MNECEKNKAVIDSQQKHWETTYNEEADFFGEEPSIAARKAVKMLKAEHKSSVLELGAGQGRDTLFFAANGFKVWALDYSENAIRAINEKAQKFGVSNMVTATCYDLRKPLPFDNESFDACYCHMLYCMALCTTELEALFNEVGRVLKPRGLSIYTVRNTSDSHFGKGIYRGEDMFEVNGFIVHFFSKEKVNGLTRGFELITIDEFEEGELPRRLFMVEMRKK